MTNYTLTPTTLVNYPEANGQQNVVFRVVWNYAGVDGDYTASFSGQTDVNYVANTTFIPYSQLTLDQVSEWVTGAWGTDALAAYKSEIDRMIDLQKNPPTQVLSLPWILSRG